MIVEQAIGEHSGDQPDREVHEEDPMPADRLRDEAAGDQADGRAARNDEAEDADRAGALARLGEHRHDHPQDDRRARRPTDALHQARGDQDRLAEREPAGQRRQGEQPEAEEEDTLAAKQVAEPPRQQE